MKTILFLFILLTASLGWVSAQDTTSLQVAPSDQVRYPDASQILNKADPKVTTPQTTVAAPSLSPAGRPLVGAVPVPARVQPVTPAHGWFLRWVVAGDEAGAQTWAQGLGRAFVLNPAGEGQWEVLVGPLDAASAPEALKGQAGVAVLVKR